MKIDISQSAQRLVEKYGNDRVIVQSNYVKITGTLIGCSHTGEEIFFKDTTSFDGYYHSDYEFRVYSSYKIKPICEIAPEEKILGIMYPHATLTMTLVMHTFDKERKYIKELMEKTNNVYKRI